MVTVSVVIPTYNRVDVLPRAIESVLEQSFGDFELIIVDDGSTDETSTKVSGYRDDRLEYVRLDETSGANAARNVGVRRASGRFVSFLDSDDAFHPTHLDRAVEILEDQPRGCMGVATGVAVVEESSVIDRTTPPGTITYDDILRGNVIGGFSCLTVRTSCFDEIGPLDPSLPSWQDFDFYLRVLDGFTMVGLDDVLVHYFERDDAISVDYDRKLRGQDRVLEKHRHRFTADTFAYWHYARAFVHAEAGEIHEARRHFAQAAISKPTNPKHLYHLVASSFGRRGFEASLGLKYTVKTLLRP